MRYTEWPRADREEPAAPLVIWVLGDDRVAAALAELGASAGPIGGRRIEVRTAGAVDAGTPEWNRLVAEIGAAQVLFVGGELGRERAARLLDELAGEDLLTIGDIQDFPAAGGMLGLATERGRIVFDANPEAIRESRVQVSARVLKLARGLVGGGTR